ncbi:MAG: LacI family DNA-binding transcriptional regulator, partial [Eubacteriales bacterium]
MEKDCRDGSVNIYDIARMANVSIATVSRVMNHSGKVSEKTRKKVEKIMEEIDYTPNAFAQGLGLNTMHAVGILVPTIADTFMAVSVDYLEKKLAEEGYNCILSCSGFELEGKKLQTKVLLSKHIDALILVGSTYAGRSGDPEETEYIREAALKVPVFTINCNIEGENVYSA